MLQEDAAFVESLFLLVPLESSIIGGKRPPDNAYADMMVLDLLLSLVLCGCFWSF